MRTAREVAQEVMDIAYEIFGLRKENTSDLLSGPKLGDAFKLECALRIVMLLEEQKFRAEHPNIHYNTHTYTNMKDQLKDTNKIMVELGKEKTDEGSTT